MHKILFISTCFLLCACGGSGDGETVQNVPVSSSPNPPITPSTANTTAQAGHTFAMFKAHDISLINTSPNLVNVQIMDENQTVLIQTSLIPGGSKSFAIPIPVGNAQTHILWSGKSGIDDTYTSEKSTVDISQAIIFNGFN